MTNNLLTLFCLVEGQSTSKAFSLKPKPADTVDNLKDLIKAKKTSRFDNVAADELTLWRVSIPIAEDNGETILLDNVANNDKKKLGPATRLSKVFPNELPGESVHIIVQHPSQASSGDLHSEIAALRMQLSDIQDSTVKLGIIVKPDKRVAFTWPATMETATLDDLRKNIFNEYPQYAHDQYLEIFVYDGPAKPTRICDNEDLRKILKIAKITSKTKLTISLETPSKSFSAWTFKDVCEQYDLSVASDPALEALKPFTDIQSIPLHTDFQKATQDLLIQEVEARVDVLPLRGGNEATRSMVIASFLVAATRLFKDDLYLMSQRHLSGRRGNGKVDFSVHPRKTQDCTLGVMQVKREDFRQGVGQNLVQLESALTEKKRKREKYDIDGDKEPPSKQRAYGIVTDAEKWAFVECTMNEDETLSFRMSWLDASLNFGGDWKDEAKRIFATIAWLWSRMVDEIPARDRHSRKLSVSTSNKRINLQ